MAIFEALPSGFVVLVIASLVLISIGFFADSVVPEAAGEEPKPLSRKTNIALALGYLLLFGFWIANFVDFLGNDKRDWFMILVSLFAIGVLLLHTVAHARAALFYDRAVDIPE